jgi:hypothetical protein
MIKKSAIRVATGSDAFILTTADNHKRLAIENPDLKEFRLTLTITWEEFRDPAQAPGSLWLGYSLAKNTPALNGIGTSVPIPVRVAPKPENLEIKTFLIVTLGEITVHYTGQAKAHIWLSFFAEYVD